MAPKGDAPSGAAVPKLGLPPVDANTKAERGLASPMAKHETKTLKKLAQGIGRNPIEIGFTIYSLTNVDPVEQTFHPSRDAGHDAGAAAHPEQHVDTRHIRFERC